AHVLCVESLARADQFRGPRRLGIAQVPGEAVEPRLGWDRARAAGGEAFVLAARRRRSLPAFLGAVGDLADGLSLLVEELERHRFLLLGLAFEAVVDQRPGGRVRSGVPAAAGRPRD